MRTARSLTVCRSRSICLGGWGECVTHTPPPAMHAPHHAWTPVTHSPAMHTTPATHAPPPRGQNHRRLWKCNLAPTSLRAVNMRLNYEVTFAGRFICSILVMTHERSHYETTLWWIQKALIWSPTCSKLESAAVKPCNTLSRKAFGSYFSFSSETTNVT